MLRLVLVGHGRMAGALSRALARAPEGSVLVRRASRAALAKPGGALRDFAGEAAACWVLAVRDGGISECGALLVRGALAKRGDTALHLAGMLGPAALDALRSAGVAVGALHPLVAVAAPDDPPPLAGLAASFEGDDRAWSDARALCSACEMTAVRIAGVDRAAYHAGAALMATGAVALAQGARLAWRGAVAGPFSDATASRFAASLLRSVAHNVAAVGPSKALASPLLRGDVAAVGAHFDALRTVGAGPLALYVSAVSVVLRDLVERSVLGEEQARAVAELLRREGPPHA